jgi:hypothetical protein
MSLFIYEHWDMKDVIIFKFEMLFDHSKYINYRMTVQYFKLRILFIIIV